MVILSDWSFGSTECIQLVAAFATFLAIAVSLWISFRRNIIKISLIAKKKSGDLIISNVGKTRFTITGFGLKVNGEYYMNPYEEFRKGILQNSVGLNPSGFAITSGIVVLNPGECVTTTFDKSKKDLIYKFKKNFYLFVLVNQKLIFKKYNFNNLDIACVKNNDVDGLIKMKKSQVITHIQWLVD
jgi:hypothetical protein